MGIASAALLLSLYSSPPVNRSDICGERRLRDRCCCFLEAKKQPSTTIRRPCPGTPERSGGRLPRTACILPRRASRIRPRRTRRRSRRAERTLLPASIAGCTRPRTPSRSRRSQGTSAGNRPSRDQPRRLGCAASHSWAHATHSLMHSCRLSFAMVVLLSSSGFEGILRNRPETQIETARSCITKFLQAVAQPLFARLNRVMLHMHSFGLHVCQNLLYAIERFEPVSNLLGAALTNHAGAASSVSTRGTFSPS